MAYRVDEIDLDWAYRGERADGLFSQQRGVQDYKHPGLLLDKWIPYGTDRIKPPYQQRNEFAVSERVRRVWFTEVMKAGLDTDILKAQRARWEETIEHSLCDQLKPFALETASRLIVGLGAEHALETAITLDRNSGAPIIPGSALKGVARTFALIGIAQQLHFSDQQIETALNTLDNWLSEAEINWESLEPYGLSSLDQDQRNTLVQWIETFRSVFGYVGAVGRAIFFNAIYAGNDNPFEVDVMTPHFGKYYIEGAAPSDDQNPVPVTYLVVREDRPFWFAVGGKHPCNIVLAKQARFWLREGLIAYGVGAKTAQGYGVFRKPTQKG